VSTLPLSADLREAVVTACGEAFHYKDTLRPVFVNAGVPGQLFDALRQQDNKSKYTICREILLELDRRGEPGLKVQRAIVAELAALRAPMADADPQQGRRALERVRAMAKDARVLVDQDSGEIAARRKRRALEEAARTAEAEKKAELRKRFYELAQPSTQRTPQQRGYAFEGFLKDLFASERIPFRGSYRVGSVEQIDGAFKLDSRDYLVEARWRNEPPAINDVFTFTQKIEGKADGTRGLFVSMLGPRPEVVDQLSRVTKRVLIMDGQDLAVVVQGLRTLREALELKADKAAHEGVLFYALGQAQAA
jgi:hypothetical protein